MKLIATQTLTSAQPSITFSDIPQNFTDLYALISIRLTSTGGPTGGAFIRFNGNTSNYSMRRIYGNGSGAFSDTDTSININQVGSTATANTFGSTSFYIPNYTSSVAKSASNDDVSENNATSAIQLLGASLWNNTAAITSLSVEGIGTTLVAGSTASLYGIGGAGDGWAPKATGGVIQKIDGYYVHTFTASGTFTPTESLTDVEYLVVAGGGGGAGIRPSLNGGGGGGGGYRSSMTGENSGGGASAEAKLSLTSGTAYTVTVGAGGARNANGVNSVFGTITSVGGGAGGQNTPSNGGSGGGGGGGTSAFGTGTANQGFDGGGGAPGSPFTTGGGGGASSVGAGFSVSGSGNGGSGLSSLITGSTIGRAGGGGGGAAGALTGGLAGSGGGGVGGSSSVSPTVGAMNAGGGGGGGDGTNNDGQAGGSGIVVVRYAA
jgi:hypothetical protein